MQSSDTKRTMRKENMEAFYSRLMDFEKKKKEAIEKNKQQKLEKEIEEQTKKSIHKGKQKD